MASLNLHDLQFVLKQILIAEAHAAGTPLSQLIENPLLPHGLRTVDGTYNNIVPGRETLGSAGQPFPSMLTPDYRNDADGDSIDLNGPAPGGVLTNTDYAQPGNVVDADPRIISNLIVDQTASNPAAVTAAADNGGAVAFDHDNDPNTPALHFIPNVAPDEGLSAPFNSWMTLFGQFFDHGLDLVAKGGNGFVFVPLQPDDPLYDPNSNSNFMLLTRTSASPGADGVFGTADDVRAVNKTTPFVDQNQTYTSHASHQVFLREYAPDASGKPVATGRMLDGADGGLPTWADVKAQALMLGIRLTDADVTNGPLLATDPYGQFLRGPNGYAQLVMPGLNPGDPPRLVEGDPLNPVSASGALRNGHAFLDDIAHFANPIDGRTGQMMQADTDGVINPGGPGAGTYDNELLDRHFITGDGRGNENIGLTAVHHVFHSEHNRQVEEIKLTLLTGNDLALLNSYLASPVAAIPASQAGIDSLAWNGERLFQAARFATEMQYQHLVFEEFARKIQPDVDIFVFNTMTDINPAIVNEFADVVYRFGHSMLTEKVSLMGIQNNQTEVGLIDAFLNPVMFSDLAQGDADVAAGAIIRGMTKQVGNEIDEFVTEALRNNLLGLPLDLATINITRGRENGVPTLNNARAQFHEMTADTQLRPYTSWVDFAYNLHNTASIVNFIAAYGQHQSITGATTLADKRLAAESLIFGTPGVNGAAAPADRLDFLNSTGAWAAQESGLNMVDFWIGGLAEKKMPFGGMLGSTFAFVFEVTMENLQNGDRFYYLSRTQGLNFFNELENNSFAHMVMVNSDLGNGNQGHLPGDIFSVPNHILELNQALQIEVDPQHADPMQQAVTPLVIRRDTNGDGVTDYLQYTGADHVVLGGTEGNDTLISGGGDDTVWGDGGDDYIEAGYGVDIVHGGKGNDVIVNAGTDIGETDVLHGEAGDDVIHGGSGLALIIGGDGSDFISTGKDGKEAFGGKGNDFILGGEGHDFLLGNEGDDWIESGNGFDTIAGDNSELFFNSTIQGHDVMFANQNEMDFDGESGDDIMVQGESVMRNEGMHGFDWATHKDSPVAANSDMRIPIFTTDQQDVLRNRFDTVEGLSGWELNDILRGDDRHNDPTLVAELFMGPLHELTPEGVARISGMQAMLGTATSFNGGNILLGGGGSDLIEGRGGNDLIDGNAWLNVRLSIRDRNNPDVELFSVDSLKDIQARLFTREILPSQLHIVREIINAPSNGETDVAQFSGIRTQYTVDRVDSNTWKVTHSGGAGPDGTDTVRNVEVLRFADQDMVLNRAAAGTLVLSDGSPSVGDEITVSNANITDQDGRALAAFSYQWQVMTASVFVDIPGATGNSLTVTPDFVGKQIRVIATFTDDQGNREVVASPASTHIGALFIGDGFNNTLNGTQFSDTIFGRAGNDTINGNAGDDELSGEDGDDAISGGAGNDLLDGGAGNDTMRGNAGNDTYVVDSSSDAVIELAGQGTDTVRTTLSSYMLDANVENLTYTGTAAFTGTGNALNNVITGGDGNDMLDGSTGNDRMAGRGGNDTYVVDSTGDAVVEEAGGGTDTIRTTLASYTLATGSNVENLTYTGSGNFTGIGNELDNVITGGTGGDVLDGAIGNDTMRGGAGNDSYGVDSTGDVVVEEAGGGTDTIRTTLASYTLATGSNVENLTYTGSGNFTGTGNELDNVITGGAGDDVLDGAAGNDTMTGGASNDTYVVDSIDDAVVEARDQGTDTVQTTLLAYTLGTNLENLAYVGNYIDPATGGVARFHGRGNHHDNLLTGGVGADNLYGGRGNDTFIVNHAGDIVVEDLDRGNDTVLTSLSNYALRADVENLTYTGSGSFTGIGNELDNVITGGTGGDVLDGAIGNDTMIGGAGNDTYVVDSTGDVVVEEAGGGTDTIRTTLASYTLATGSNVENLTYTGSGSFTGTGNELDNVITGGAGDDVLDGAAGNDTMIGGAGNDTYVVDSIDDALVEARDQGTDTVQTTLLAYTLGTNLENLAYIGDYIDPATGGIARFHGRGNHHDNLLTGGVGADNLYGGRGNDTFIVNHAGDIVVEDLDRGNDTVLTSLSNYALRANVENLTYTGSGSFTGTGNGLDNVITGGTGNDVFEGGGGNDVFVFRPGFGQDTILDFDANPPGGQDLLDISALGITAETFDSSVVISLAASGLDTLVQIGSNSIALSGVGDPSTVTSGDFLLAV